MASVEDIMCDDEESVVAEQENEPHKQSPDDPIAHHLNTVSHQTLDLALSSTTKQDLLKAFGHDTKNAFHIIQKLKLGAHHLKKTAHERSSAKKHGLYMSVSMFG